MANNLTFTTATFATTNMLPDADNELTSQWCRQVAMNISRAVGVEGTLICEPTSVATLGTGYIHYTGFTEPPSVDIWLYENQVNLYQWMEAYTPRSESGRVVGKQLRWTTNDGTGTLHLMVFPHPHLGDILGAENYDFDQGSHGTWIYRLRGI